MFAAFLLACAQEPPPERALNTSALDLSPEPRDVAVLELVEVMGRRWESASGSGWVDLCYVRAGTAPTEATECSVERFSMVDGRWYLRAEVDGETRAYRVAMVKEGDTSPVIRLQDGEEARYSWIDRSSGRLRWTLPTGEGEYRL